MNDLQIFTNDQFGTIRTITEKGKTLFCGSDVAKALGYAKPQNAIAQHCKGALKRGIGVQTGLKSDGSPSVQNVAMLFIPEGDIYRLAASSQLPGAEKFESWIFDEVLPSIRKTGSYSVKPMTDYQQMIANTRAENARIRKAQILERLANQYSGTYKQVLHAHATHELTGEYLLPLPKLEARTYSATEIGNMLGITSNKVGAIANQNGLKTEQYGAWFHDKAKHTNKEVSSFRYFESVVPIMRGLI